MHAHPMVDRTLPHQIVLRQHGADTMVSCNCQRGTPPGGGSLRFRPLAYCPPGDAPGILAVYRAHLPEVTP